MNIILRLALWITPALMIIIADRYFAYHFFMLSAVSILEICLSVRRKNKVALIFLIISGGIYMCFLSPLSSYIRESTRLTRETYAESMTTLSLLNIDPSDTVMYLDDGLGAYLMENKSWLDEYYVLPLQRLREESDNNTHVKALKKALAYDGRFITVFDRWFFYEGNNQKLKEKISREYQKKGELPMYTFEVNIFKKPTRERIIDIYERKNLQ